MRKKEQRLWDRFRTALVAAKIIHERIENIVGVGTPDVHSIRWWCELKATVAAPKRPATPLLPAGDGLSVDQVNWHLWWTSNGGRSYVLIGVGGHENYLLDGELAEQINQMSYQQVKAAAIARALHGRNNWVDIMEELKRED